MVHGKLDPSPSQIPHYKWMEIQEDECANQMINFIREEIVHTAMSAVYKSHIVNTSYSFVVNSAHVAWLQLFNWMNLECDPGDNLTTTKSHWADDEERLCESATPDSWVFGNVKIRESISSIPEHKNCVACCDQINYLQILPQNMTRQSSPDFSRESTESSVDKVVSPLEPKRSTELAYEPNSKERIIADDKYTGSEGAGHNNEDAEKSSDRSEALSIFTRTIYMPKQQLPVQGWSSGRNQSGFQHGGDVFHRKSRKSWKLDDVKPPRKISLDRLPENRLGMKYVLVADQHAPSKLSDDTRKSATSKTLSRRSTKIRPNRDN